ncbi:MAG TPA: efflux RND transporter periplasmic adaptor subunit [Burkholderiaceae bacterium]|nr:efflux RND transporter periplasmic adaptor subunit [Burkholderiaceae bacterium]
MAIGKLHTLVAVVGIAAAGAAAWWWQRSTPASAPADAVAVASPASGAASGGGAARPGGGGPAAVEVARAQTMRIEEDAQAVGSVRAAQTIVVRPEVSGRIVRLGFKDGDRVRRGQVLAQLDDQLQRAQLRQAEAQAAIARTNLQRSRELLAQNFVSQSAVDQNAAALDVAEAQVALAQAQLARLTIAAPFDGVAGIRSVSVGDYLKDGADIVSLEDRSRLWVDFRLPERFVGSVRVGQTVAMSLDALPGRNFDGTVEALDALVDTSGRSLLVRARIERPVAELKSGMYARARVVFAVREQAVVVPEEALVPVGGKQYLYKVVDAPSDAPGAAKVAQRLEARLGARLPGRVEILSGIAPGDVVVTAGHQRLTRGDSVPVRVVDLARAGEGPGPRAGRPGGASAPGAASGPRNGSAV